jgi:hypothetical protein
MTDFNKPDLKQMEVFLVIVVVIDVMIVGFFIRNDLAMGSLIALILVVPTPAAVLFKVILLEKKKMKRVETKGASF